MNFTRHAYERYRQFHMLDLPQATDEDARAILEANAARATRIPARTHRGDEVWTIHALGVELVVKRDGDFEKPVCVTVLPPARFRGLTPLLAEQAEESAKRAAERVAEAERQLEQSKKATGARNTLVGQAAKAGKEKDKPGTSAALQAEAHAAAAARKLDAAQAQRAYEERLQQAKNEAHVARNERDIILEALRAMRAQLAQELSAEIFEKHNIQTSYEGDSNYAVVPLLSTLAGRCDREIPSGVMPIEEFANAIRNRVGTGSLERAAETWRIVQAAALDVSIHLPDGRLLWLCDYE